MMEIASLPIENIRYRPDARHRSDEKLTELQESIGRLGLINPIRVRRFPDGADTYEVVAGAHRLQACGLLGWSEVPCIVVTDDDVTAEMAMIAENLHRAELSKLERDEQVARWIELSGQQSSDDDPFESFYAVLESDEPKGGSDGQVAQIAPAVLSDGGNKLAQPEPVYGGRGNTGGVRAAARELGIEKEDARRAVKVASLSDEAKAAAREIGLDDNRTALLEAAKHDTAEAQVKALQERKLSAASRAEQKPDPTYEQLRSAILFLCDLKPEEYSRLCPPPKRAAMCQKLSHLEQVFEKVREAVSE